MHGGALHIFGGHWNGDDLWRAARSGADILIVWYLIYRLMMLAKGTRAWQIITGLLVSVAVLAFSSWAGLAALNWILQKLLYLGPVAIVILFYPELRHALEEVGRLGFWGRSFTGLGREDLSAMIGELTRVADTLSEKKIGALIVIERETGLSDIIETGTPLSADVNADLLESIFYPGGRLHDGAVIIRQGRVAAAGCTLPLSDNPQVGARVHTRHKAALGITEQSDAVALVVSEETGIISLVFNGKMARGLRGDDLRARLMAEVSGKERPPALRRRRGRSASVAARVGVPAETTPSADSPKPTPPKEQEPDVQASSTSLNL